MRGCFVLTLVALCLTRANGQGDQGHSMGPNQRPTVRNPNSQHENLLIAQRPLIQLEQQRRQQLPQVQPLVQRPQPSVQHGNHGPLPYVRDPRLQHNVPLSQQRIQQSRQRPPNFDQHVRQQRPLSNQLPPRNFQQPSGLLPSQNGAGLPQVEQQFRANKLPPSIIQYIHPSSAKSPAPSGQDGKIGGMLQDVASHLSGKGGKLGAGDMSLLDMTYRVNNALGNWSNKLADILAQMERLFNQPFFDMVSSVKRFIKAFNNNSADDYDDDDEDEDDDYYDDDYDDDDREYDDYDYEDGEYDD